MEKINIHGHKWAAISKQFGGHRTEHMVKNKFQSLIKRYGKANISTNKINKHIMQQVLKKLKT